jgi:hypothetical protein
MDPLMHYGPLEGISLEESMEELELMSDAFFVGHLKEEDRTEIDSDPEEEDVEEELTF